MPLLIRGSKTKSKSLKLNIEDSLKVETDLITPKYLNPTIQQVKKPSKNRKEYHKDYYQSHKKKCEVCNKEFLLPNFNRHLRTKKHLEKVKKEEEIDELISEDVYKRLEKKFASSTVKSHRYNLKRMDITTKGDLKDYHKVKTYLETLENPSLKKTLLNSLLRVYEEVHNGSDPIYTKFKKLFDVYSKKDIEHRVNRKTTEKERTKFIKWEEVIEHCKEFINLKITSKTSPKMCMRKLLSQFLVNLPPMRLNEYISTKLKLYDPKKDNYIKNGVWVCNDYKTKKHFGKHELKLPQSILNTIEEIQKVHKSNYLFPAYTQEGSLHENTFRKLLEDVLGIKTDLQTLRKVYRSNLEDKKTSFEDLQKISFQMKHQFNTSMANYTIYSNRRK